MTARGAPLPLPLPLSCLAPARRDAAAAMAAAAFAARVDEEYVLSDWHLVRSWGEAAAVAATVALPSSAVCRRLCDPVDWLPGVELLGLELPGGVKKSGNAWAWE